MVSNKKNLVKVLFFLLYLSVLTFAQNSNSITLTGKLLDAQGNPVGSEEPVTVDVHVNLYDQQNGGNLRYSESFLISNSQGITVDNGDALVHLGKGTSNDNLPQVITQFSNLWVEMTVDGDVLSRTPLSAAPGVLRNSSTRVSSLDN